MRHSEQFVTDVLDVVARKFVNDTAPEGAPQPAWDALPANKRQEIKSDLLMTVLVVLDAAKDVRGEVHVATCWPLLDPEVAEALVSQREDDHGRSDWTWLRTADGDLMLGLFPRGDTYEALSQGPASDDWETAMSNDTICSHTHVVDD